MKYEGQTIAEATHVVLPKSVWAECRAILGRLPYDEISGVLHGADMVLRGVKLEDPESD